MAGYCAIQPPEEPFSRLGVSPRLQVHVDDVAVLIHRSPQVVALTGNRDEYFVDEEVSPNPGLCSANIRSGAD